MRAASVKHSLQQADEMEVTARYDALVDEVGEWVTTMGRSVEVV